MEFSESEWLANVQVWCMVGNKRHSTIKEETTKTILWIYKTFSTYTIYIALNKYHFECKLKILVKKCKSKVIQLKQNIYLWSL